ncbi:hypothetical protein Agabi119p4_11259 [Agaricus bisporus var. burnettii]|uniref:Uncharacterized protein n=1 Tax=Agaricus bisporus var. burnettii TaxID=192524 RepID=A0A8H7EVW2_AGABI|nr:hypothetical protein Agabi119p4_11259 [Agaricus bisporus var. burnettii]
MFDFGDWARAPQSSKARQWVEARDWWSHSVLLTNACTNKPRVAKSTPQRAAVSPILVGIDQPGDTSAARPALHFTVNHLSRTYNDQVSFSLLAFGYWGTVVLGFVTRCIGLVVARRGFA